MVDVPRVALHADLRALGTLLPVHRLLVLERQLSIRGVYREIGVFRIVVVLNGVRR